MARGFESKSVTDQQEAAFGGSAPRGDAGPPANVRKLELARADLLNRIEAAVGNDRYREMLRRALADVDKELAALS
jgi:hypothetical protein